MQDDFRFPRFVHGKSRAEAIQYMSLILALDESPSSMQIPRGEVACNKPKAQAKGIE